MKFNDKAFNLMEKTMGRYRSIVPLPGDASSRSYFRVNGFNGSYIICLDELAAGKAPDDYPYNIVYGHLRASGIPVPEIIGQDPVNGIFLLEDCGDDLLEVLYPSLGKAEIIGIYKGIIDALVPIQKIRGRGERPFSMMFDAGRLMYEFNFFTAHYLYRAAAEKSPLLFDELRREFSEISAELDRPHQFVFTHRDFHSRNIILREGKPFIIDFQDARMGMPQYDLASLLRDSYVRLDEDVFGLMKGYYYTHSKDEGIHSMGRDEFELFFDLVAFQRNIKAVGTFGYQLFYRNNPFYEKFIRPTLGYIRDYAERRAVLGKAYGILKKMLPENII
ncbi:MAG: phosphotransferase [Spirochaetes bacterium]|jgi:hypothetical protein|nr:phosphotransferase [Spirochaetota bacterium]